MLHTKFQGPTPDFDKIFLAFPYITLYQIDEPLARPLLTIGS